MKFILTADWHLRMDRPRCRLDEDWLQTQRSHIRKVQELASKWQVPVIHTGDLFHHPRVATEVVNMAIDEIKKFHYGFYLLAGNHDLPYHSVDNIQQSSIGTVLHMVQTPHTFPWSGFVWAHFGQDKTAELPADIRLLHRLVWPDEATRPSVVDDIGQTAQELMQEFPERIICCGDYHHRFVFKSGNRMVINPGCLNIQAADMIGYTPGVYLVDPDPRADDPRFLEIPDDGSIVTDAYLRESELREDRMDALVSRLQSGSAVTLDYDTNVDRLATHLSPLGKEVLHEIRLEVDSHA